MEGITESIVTNDYNTRLGKQHKNAPMEAFAAQIKCWRHVSHVRKSCKKRSKKFGFPMILAHLSQRLTGEFIVYPWSGVVVVVHNAL